jgi:hypothetical protein
LISNCLRSLPHFDIHGSGAGCAAIAPAGNNCYWRRYICLYGYVGIGANTFWTIVVTLTSAALLYSLISRVIKGRKRLPSSRKILKQLAQALRPLDPSEAEIEQTLALFRKKQTLLGVGLKSASINSAIKENFARR